MTEVKLVISYLCKVFSGVFAETIKPEHFRLCKFDKANDTVIPLLWRLLHKLCCPFGSNIEENCSYDSVICVKLSFASFKYDCVSFYNLPANMVSGSRELLLALGWYLSTNRFERLIKLYISNSVIQDEYPRQPNQEPDPTETENSHLQTEDEMINYINWVSGRIKNNIAYVCNLSSELINLTSKVHSLTEGAYGLPHLSVAELLMFKDHSLINQILNEYQHVITILENYLLWKKKQNVFWNWMESVIKEESDSLSVQSEQDFNKFIQILKAEIRKQAVEPDDSQQIYKRHKGLSLKSRMIRIGACGQNTNKSLMINKILSDVDRQLEKFRSTQKTKCSQIMRTWNSVTEDEQDDSSK